MTEVLVYILLAAVAALFGAVAGRVFAVEAQNRRIALFAATYVGAGIGLLIAFPVASLLTVLGLLRYSESEFSVLDAFDGTGTAMLLGIASGAAGGLAVAMIVAVLKTFKRWTYRQA